MSRNKHINCLKLQFARMTLVIVLMFIAGESIAQQDPMYTQYMENLMTINPAYAGSKNLLSMMAVSRNQWVGMDKAPETRTFAIHSPIVNTNMGLGLSFLSDQIWPIKQNGLYLDYSYTLHFNNRRKLAFGLKAGVNFYEAGIADLTTVDPNDPLFADDINHSFLPNFGVGVFYHTDLFYMGLSVPKLIKNTINKTGFSTGQFDREEVHLFFMSGYVFEVNRIVKFKPSVLTRFVINAPVSFDFNSTLVFYDRLWVGAMCRLGDSFGGLFQLKATNQMKIGYSYDFPISRLGAFNNGTHEIMVSFDFDLGNDKIRSPRYF
ncbi:MAG TPA: type IX secretion system membrane protein PorP/SprF [Prolixibacteraceae bacterium]